MGTVQQPQQSFLVVDKRIVTEVDYEIAPLFLLAAFYVFNICYPVGCNNVFTFFEIALLGFKECQIPLSVTNFLSRLAN